jgi:hypothetical protein
MKLKFTSTLVLIASAVLLLVQSCKNDVEIFAPQSDITVVYGLLSTADAIHQIKINRVFQGEDAVANLAKDPSLSEYDNLTAILFELNDDGYGSFDTTNQWTLKERIITNKDSGYFYYPNQKIYELEAQLNNRRSYAIWIDKLDGSPIVQGTTEVIRSTGNILTKPIPQSLSRIGLTLADPTGTEPLEKVALEMALPIYAKIIDVYLDFSWHDEFYSGASPVYHTISYKIGTYVTNNVATRDGDQSIIKGELNPTAFYEFIKSHAPVVPDGSDLKQRVAEDIPLKFRFITGGTEFNTYIEVSAPSTSLLETKPEYTNMTNGVGLFSCRHFDEKESLMSGKSIVYLVDGAIMSGSRFCNYDNSTDPKYCF